MSITFFVVGGVIFSVYMYFTVWNIYNSADKSKRENYGHFGSEGCDLPENTQVEVQKPQTVILEDELEDEEDFYSL